MPNSVPIAPVHGSGYEVFGQRFDNTGVAQGGKFQVNTYTTDTQGAPAIAMDGFGNSAVAWHSHGQDGNEFGVFRQRFGGTGTPVSSEFSANTFATDWQALPDVGMDDEGNFVVS